MPWFGLFDLLFLALKIDLKINKFQIAKLSAIALIAFTPADFVRAEQDKDVRLRSPTTLIKGVATFRSSSCGISDSLNNAKPCQAKIAAASHLLFVVRHQNSSKSVLTFMTDADGSFDFYLLPGHYDLTLAKPNLNMNFTKKEILVTGESNENLQIEINLLFQ